MELDKFNHESIVGTGNRSFLFDERFCFFVVVAVLEDNVCDNKGHRPGNSLNAVDEDIFLVFMCCLDEFDNFVEKTLYILVLRVF